MFRAILDDYIVYINMSAYVFLIITLKPILYLYLTGNNSVSVVVLDLLHGTTNWSV